MRAGPAGVVTGVRAIAIAGMATETDATMIGTAAMVTETIAMVREASSGPVIRAMSVAAAGHRRARRAKVRRRHRWKVRHRRGPMVRRRMRDHQRPRNRPTCEVFTVSARVNYSLRTDLRARHSC
jgi:hypothetical protein